MTHATDDVTDRNGMKHDRKGLFAGSGKPGGHSSGLGGASEQQGYLHSWYGHSHIGSSQSTSGHHGHSWVSSEKKPGVFRLPSVKTSGPSKQPWRYVDSNGKSHDTRVDVITNLPVSQEFENVINALYRGEDIPMGDIENIPEVKREGKLADAVCTLDEIMHPEKYAHMTDQLNSIYKQFSCGTITSDTNESLKPGESYKVKQGREIWLVTGLPGSGKSTTFVGPISKANCARVVDSDAIKEKMPGFNKGLGAPRVHEQSKSINDRILAESLKRGDNIVYPVLGYNADYVGSQIKSFRRRGYKVNLVLNELPFSQSLARCLERRLATGRNIPLAMFKKVGDRPSEAYEKLKTMVDTYEKHTGDAVGLPKCVEKGTNDNLPPVERDRPKAFSYHGMPLGEIGGYHHDGFGNVSITPPSQESQFSKEFGVPKGKPKYWKSGWMDLFKKHLHGHDSNHEHGLDSADGMAFDVDRFGNMIVLDSMSTAGAHVCRDEEIDIEEIPEAYGGEIDGWETAKDLARFHYVHDSL